MSKRKPRKRFFNTYRFMKEIGRSLNKRNCNGYSFNQLWKCKRFTYDPNLRY